MKPVPQHELGQIHFPNSSSFLGSTAQLRPWPPPQNTAEFLGGFSTVFFFTGYGCYPHAQPPSRRTRPLNLYPPFLWFCIPLLFLYYKQKLTVVVTLQSQELFSLYFPEHSPLRKMLQIRVVDSTETDTCYVSIFARKSIKFCLGSV
jgi:hypothetical protein